jgi:hypothetical protein
VLVSIPLPEALLRVLIVISGELLRAADEPLQIGPLLEALDDEVSVIRHKAARNYREFFVFRSAQELRRDQSDRVSVCERRRTILAAKRQEVTVVTEVVEAGIWRG